MWRNDKGITFCTAYPMLVFLDKNQKYSILNVDLSNMIQIIHSFQIGKDKLREGSWLHQVCSAASAWALKGGVSLSSMRVFVCAQDTFMSFLLVLAGEIGNNAMRELPFSGQQTGINPI